MLRVIGGSLRGRRFSAPPGRHTRPTADAVREAMFNTLATLLDLDGARVVDLFAGSGALGIEALSRGAAHCTFVESHRRTAAGIRANLEALGLPPERWEVVAGRAEGWVAHAPPGLPVALVLADPPYGFGGHDALLAALERAGLPAPDGLIVLELSRGTALDLPPRLAEARAKVYGDTQVRFLRVPPRETTSAPAGEVAP